jgi:hypothetical protein
MKIEVKDKGTTALQHDERQNRNLGYLNYCVSGLISRCGIGPLLVEHKKCRFYKKSTVGNRCMHYIEARDGHCDCLEAQIELNKREK